MWRKDSSEKHRRERGQALILVMLAITMLLGMAAMAIDVGLIFEERRHAQNAADAAALAGVAKLPPFGQAGDAQTEARNWAQKNGYATGSGTVVSVTYPYNADITKIEVKIDRPVSFAFGKGLGLDMTSVSARAVGEATFSVGAAGGYAIFATNSSCSGYNVDVQGANMTIIGGSHSNGRFNVGSGNNSFTGATTYTCANGFNNQNANNVFTPPPFQSAAPTSPIAYSYGSFTCTVTFTSNTTINSVPSLWVGNNANSKQLKDNVICSTANLTLASDGNTGNVTLVAQGRLTVSGSNNNLRPHPNQSWGHNVFAYSSSSGNPAIDINGSGGSMTGYIHAPNGRARIQGSGNLVIVGAVIANTVTINGSNFKFDASGLAPIWGGPGAAKLVE